MDDELGGSQLLELVTNHLRVAVHLARDRSYSSSTGKRLHSVIGELLRLAGWVSFDNGHHAMAQRYWVAALHAAHAAGDRGLGANILGFMSCQAKRLGQVRRRSPRRPLARVIRASPVVSAILTFGPPRRATAAEIRSAGWPWTGRSIGLRSPPTALRGRTDDVHTRTVVGHATCASDWSRARAHFRPRSPPRTAVSRRGPAAGADGDHPRAVAAARPDRALHLGSQAVAALRGVESRRCPVTWPPCGSPGSVRATPPSTSSPSRCMRCPVTDHRHPCTRQAVDLADVTASVRQKRRSEPSDAE